MRTAALRELVLVGRQVAGRGDERLRSALAIQPWSASAEYPCRETLTKWVREALPEVRKAVVGSVGHCAGNRHGH